MTEHTPTPWKFVPWHVEEGPSAFRAPAGHLVGNAASDADAEYIVKAVNSHSGLVSALRHARAAIATLEEYALGGAVVEHTDGSGPAYQYPIRDELLAKIDAALAT